MVDAIFKLLLLFSPIAYSVGISLNKFDLRFFEIGTIALYAASLFDIPKRQLGNIRIYIVLLLGLLIANSLMHKFQPLDIRAVECMFFGILAFVITVVYLKDHASCYKYIFWALGINIAVLLFQHIGYSPMISNVRIGHDIQCEGGMIGSISLFGTYLALIMPYLPIIVMSILALIFGLLVHHNQLCVFIPLTIAICLKAKNRLQRALLCVACFATLCVFHGKIIDSILIRWKIWQPTLDMFFEKPLMGWGFGTYYLWVGSESFSAYLPFIYGVGLLGLVWLGFLAKNFKNNFKPNKETLAVLSLACLGLIEYPFDIPRLWFTIIAVLAFYAIKQKELGNAGKVCGA